MTLLFLLQNFDCNYRLIIFCNYFLILVNYLTARTVTTEKVKKFRNIFLHKLLWSNFKLDYSAEFFTLNYLPFYNFYVILNIQNIFECSCNI